MFGGAFSGFGGQLFGNWRFRAKRRFRARVDPLAFSRFWAFLENFEGGSGSEPPVFPLLTSTSTGTSTSTSTGASTRYQYCTSTSMGTSTSTSTSTRYQY